MPEVAVTSPDPFSLDDLKKLTDADMLRVNKVIGDNLASDVVLINQLSQHIILSGGKRLRPMLVMLAARVCGYRGEDDALLAAVVEFIHTATLLHDDVVDDSEMRRGRQTASTIWGNEAAVLVGDYLYSRAFQMMVRAQSMAIMDLLANTTNVIAQGEVLQLLNVREPDTSEAKYHEVIYAKTACLFEAAARIGAMLGKVDAEQEGSLQAYGRHLGIAFQLVDDALDYSARSEQLGKNVGDDLAEGKPTLPLIRAMEIGDAAQRQLLLDQALAESAAAKKAIAGLEHGEYRQALMFLADYAVERLY